MHLQGYLVQFYWRGAVQPSATTSFVVVADVRNHHEVYMSIIYVHGIIILYKLCNFH